jgi:hypothetical protein
MKGEVFQNQKGKKALISGQWRFCFMNPGTLNGAIATVA